MDLRHSQQTIINVMEVVMKDQKRKSRHEQYETGTYHWGQRGGC
jgi:hypothetical protein